MPALLLTILLLLLQKNPFAQGSDFISVRKWNGRAIKTFYAGSPILLETKHGIPVNGIISHIQNDSVFIFLYDVRRYQSYLGVPVIDTVAIYTASLHYKDIRSVRVAKRVRGGLAQLGRIMMYGGGGYLALNAINGGYLNEPVGSKENLRKLSKAAGVLLAGFIMKKHFGSSEFGKRQKIVYIHLK